MPIERPQHHPAHFIQNENGHSLLNRLKQTLPHAQYFDVLTGYLRITGLNALLDELEQTDKTRVLVGLGTDEPTKRANAQAGELPFANAQDMSATQGQEKMRKAIRHELAEEDDGPEAEQAYRRLIALLCTPCANPQKDEAEGGNGMRLELRAYLKRGLHAKVYLQRYRLGPNAGAVITGSSNFSQTGLVENLEFNVELRDDDDLHYALWRFETLWQEATPLGEVAVQALEKDTWLNQTITPYELYLRVLQVNFEFRLREALRSQTQGWPQLPEGYETLRYQLEAAEQLDSILNLHGGVFLADVVGLGKTAITALALQRMDANAYKLIVCPPPLIDAWKETLDEFKITRYDVQSLGQLSKIPSHKRYDVVVVDEAHRFRNTTNERYDELSKLTNPAEGKVRPKVILVGATPFNNRVEDVANQLYLFQDRRQGTIPGVRNLEGLFKQWVKDREEAEQAVKQARNTGSPELEALEEKLTARDRTINQQLRDKVLKHVMVRRLRSDVTRYFKDDLAKQGLNFPEVVGPKRLLYVYEGEVEEAFQQTLSLFPTLKFARYGAKLYMKDGLPDFERSAQNHLLGFVRLLLVKRLESSKAAFCGSLERFVRATELFIKTYDEEGVVYVGMANQLLNALEHDDLARIEKWMESDKVERIARDQLRPEYRDDLGHDLHVLRDILHIWQTIDADPKAERFEDLVLQDEAFRGKRMVIFTESYDTAKHLYDTLNYRLQGEVMLYSSMGGRVHGQGALSPAEGRELIRQHFDPKVAGTGGKLRVLITTDVLAEGINLHLADRLVNYDLPWNPTKVMQRIGRINRVGTPHDKIFVYNFFPASSADEMMGLEDNITRKLGQFLELMGNDARTLTEYEELDSKQMFRKMNESPTAQEDTGEDAFSDEGYFAEIKRIRDEDPELYARLEQLPVKARCAYEAGQPQGDQSLVTFYRRNGQVGFLEMGPKANGPSERLFQEVILSLAAKPDTPNKPLPREPFDQWYALNKAHFRHLTEQGTPGDEADAAERFGKGGLRGRDAGDKAFRMLKAQYNQFKHGVEDGAEDAQQVVAVMNRLQRGGFSPGEARKLKNRLEQYKGQVASMSQLADLLKDYVHEVPHGLGQTPLVVADDQREIVLSAFLYPR